jgi:hypothetical protein
MDAEIARSLWEYDEITGVLRWKVKPCPKVRVGDPAGHPNSNGHLHVCYRGKIYLVHRVAWLISTGAWPVHEIDHVNGLRADNRLSNLREATARQNQRNRNCHRAGQARFTTYHKAKGKGKWCARSPRIDGKVKYLGLYDTMAEASEAAEKWLRENYPELA